MTIPIQPPPKASAGWDTGRVYVRARARNPWEYIGRRSDFVWQVWVFTPHQLHTGGEWRCTLETGTAWDARRRARRIVKLARQVHTESMSWPDALAWSAGLLNDDPIAVLRVQLARVRRESARRPDARTDGSHIGLFQQAQASFGRSSVGIWD
ncbi:hypothetical protein SEA_LEONARD_84 [Gordonia phage Leonard]|uniref:Uncharacterized protein n=2 Tax=Leonardvirus TaxID=2948800 RepID=A0A649VM16_9CAUD|nr:hypothetical protein BI045_gp84 [Gordonia phage Phinally]YP_010002303.1 hypothetical protein J1769_gp84 [Gordonia phage Leonard]YP_010002558.1 hypothetical protein J1772_gp81 [Gordonia phage Ali17]AMS03076.1 hypothetical protein SEA_PHINALLY_84 [Gordonia phage Phinally]AXQ60696.1 hypothetical protein SEA_ALI17_81 [Gordonia phage Ali17]QGJ93446.1 hypothetical protein SEA_LEONARD_84 [Gordonia phage Leonard]